MFFLTNIYYRSRLAIVFIMKCELSMLNFYFFKKLNNCKSANYNFNVNLMLRKCYQNVLKL